MLVPPGYSGALPAGAKPLRSPTNLIWLIGRTLVKSAADLPAVTAADGRLPAHAARPWSAGERATPLVLASFPPMLNKLVLPTGLAYFDQLGAALAENPPPNGDACALKAFAAVGIGPGLTPSTQATGAVRTALAAAAKAGPQPGHPRRGPRERLQPGRNNGWLISPRLHRRLRAQLARPGRDREFALGANTAPETVYPAARHRQPRPAPARDAPLPDPLRQGQASAGGRLLVAHDVRLGRYLHPNSLAATRSATARRACAGARRLAHARAPELAARRARSRPTGYPPREVASALSCGSTSRAARVARRGAGARRRVVRQPD